MKDQELEFHVKKLEQAFNTAPPYRRNGMRPGIQRMIFTLKASNQRLPLSLLRMERSIAQDEAEEFFDNMPI